MSVKAFVPDSPARHWVRGVVLLVVAAWMLVTFFTTTHLMPVLSFGAVILVIVAVQDFLTAYRSR